MIPDVQKAVIVGDTTGLANDVVSPYCGSGAASPDATFLLDLNTASMVRLGTAGSSFDTVLQVFLENAMCSNYPYACDDEQRGRRRSSGAGCPRAAPRGGGRLQRAQLPGPTCSRSKRGPFLP
ncbi:MAG: hypothetical protein IPH72_15915 [Sandaracinaceae bacterium]|nr:hypothetical protein [Sandaracinaceae bacterium]